MTSQKYVVQKVDGRTAKAVGLSATVLFDEHDAVEAARSLALGSDQIWEFHVRARAAFSSEIAEDSQALAVLARCRAPLCNAVVEFRPNSRRWGGSAGRCERCEEPYCAEHLADTDPSQDDGSGQYLIPLDGDYCETCISEIHLPDDEDLAL
jgi:hypothetical protein